MGEEKARFALFISCVPHPAVCPLSLSLTPTGINVYVCVSVSVCVCFLLVSLPPLLLCLLSLHFLFPFSPLHSLSTLRGFPSDMNDHTHLTRPVRLLPLHVHSFTQ